MKTYHYHIEHNGKLFKITGNFGNVHVIYNKQCLIFGLMTGNDAENWIWSNY